MPEDTESPQNEKICPVMTDGDEAHDYQYCDESACAWWHEPEYEEEQGCCALLRIAQASWKSMED